MQIQQFTLAQCDSNPGSTSSMAAVYTGKSGIGPTGSSATQTATTPDTGTHTSQRTFSTWQTTTNTYSALTVYVSSKYATTAGSGSGYLWYSTDGGSNWLSISNSTTSQATHSAVITGTALTSLQVITCSAANVSAEQRQRPFMTFGRRGLTQQATSCLVSSVLYFISSATKLSGYCWREEQT